MFKEKNGKGGSQGDVKANSKPVELEGFRKQ
jgi:hypothetical protein